MTAGHLPQKVMLYHQLHADIITAEALVDRPGVAVVESAAASGRHPTRSAPTSG